MEFVNAHIDENPFMTCADIAIELSVSKELVRLCLHKLNLSYKRARYYGKAKNSVELTSRFLNLRDKFFAEGRPIYSVDETGFGRFSYQCRMGWCTAGEKLRIMKDKPSETSQTVIACASSDTQNIANRCMHDTYDNDNNNTSLTLDACTWDNLAGPSAFRPFRH